MNKYIILSVDGVLNTPDLIRRNVLFDTQLVLKIQDIVDATAARVTILYQRGGRNYSDKNFYNTILRNIGLKHGILDVTTVESLRPKLRNKYCIITSDASLWNMKKVIITNREYGIQDSDVRKAIEILGDQNG